MEVVGQPPRLPESNHDHPPKSPGRNSFFIQDILSPEFGNRQLKEQYYAYLHYYYSLHMHNMMVLRNQQQLQRLQKDKLNLESPGIQFEQKAKTLDHSGGVVRPIPRNISNGSGKTTIVHSTASFPVEAHTVLKPTVFPVAERNLSHQFLSHETREMTSQMLDIDVDRVCQKDRSLVSSDHDGQKRRGEFCTTKIKESPSRCKTNEVRTESRDEAGKPFGGENDDHQDGGQNDKGDGKSVWPAWVYCTRYSDRPSSGPRSRKMKRKSSTETVVTPCGGDGLNEKRPRIAFTNEQLARLKREFDENRYLTEERRSKLAGELDLTESQVKIWFQNKRAKLKKSCGARNPLAIQLMQQGLYNHATVPLDDQE